jgi:SAM-dependent methyltransferase
MNDNPWEDAYRRDGHIFTDIPPIVSEFANLLEQNGLTGSRSLDVGCGNGRMLIYFAQHGYRVTGFDSSPSALRLSREWLSREKLPGNVFLSDSRHTFPFSKGTFDVLISTQVIHHARLKTILFTINEITRVVHSGGYILITVPALRETSETRDGEEIERHTFVPFSGTEKGLPHHLFTPDEFREYFPRFDILSLNEDDNQHIALIGRKK